MKTALAILLILSLVLTASSQSFISSLAPNSSSLREGIIGGQGGYNPSFNPADNWIASTNAAMLASPKLADLNGDGADEMLMTTYDIVNPYSGGYLHAWNMDGFELTGFPIHLTGAPPGTPAVGDLDNDGDLEIVQGTWQYLYVFNRDGTPFPGWPLPMYITQAVALADLDGDNDLEIIVPVSNEMRVYHHTGMLMIAIPISAPYDLTAAAVGDLEGDGTLEIVTGTFQAAGSTAGSILAWRPNGQLVNGFPVNTAGSIKAPPALADLDNDGQLEVIADCWNLSGTDYLYVWEFNGTISQGWPVQAAYIRLSSPSVGDLDGNGDLEIVVGGMSSSPAGEKVHAYHHTGIPVSGFPVVLPNPGAGNVNSTCTVGNIDTDDYPEIVIKGANNLFALNHDGSSVPGFPVLLDDQNHTGTTSPTPAIGNMDDDDNAEIFAASCFNFVIMVDQPGGYIQTLNYWPTFRSDPLNKAVYVSPNPPNLDVALKPQVGGIVVPQVGGSFQFIASAMNRGPVVQPFAVWARLKYPDGSYSSPTLGPITINPPQNLIVSRMRTQNVASTWPAGNYYYMGYANWTYSYPAIDSTYFSFMKSTTGDGPIVWDASCTGEPFPFEVTGATLEYPIVSNYNLVNVTPNPFNPTTTIRYELRTASFVSLKVFDTTGRLVATSVDGWREIGSHEVTFDGSQLSSGLYFVRMKAADFTAVSKIMLVK